MKKLLQVLALLGNLLLLTHPLRADVGDIYVANFAAGNVYRVTPDGTKTVFVSGLTSPSGVAFDAKGNLFVADFAANTISMVTPQAVKTTFLSGLSKPYGLAFDSAGNLYSADIGSGKIFKTTPGGVKSTFASGLNSPAGLAFDHVGNLFETDFGSGQVFKFTPAGAKSTFATGLTSPGGITLDVAGNIYVADATGTVFKFTPAGAKSASVTGLSQPTGLVFDRVGNLYVADNATGLISKVIPAGTRTTLVSGLSNPQYLAIQPPTRQLLNISTRAKVEGGDNVMIAGFIVGPADSGDNTVVVRVLGPSLAQAGVSGPLSDPSLELFKGQTLLKANNDWKDTQEQAITATGLAPTDDHESAILITLAPGTYTAVVSSANSSTGVALVEVYKLQ
ncbi:MAG: hypothetical protein H0X40_14920 [Chthoniobacterales bacterium]|nr:hypothetical protein [Chthoniobacterales bacterium]